MTNKQLRLVYVEVEPNTQWNVYTDSQERELLGAVHYISYVFPMKIFKPNGEYWFIPDSSYGYSSLDVGIGKTKEKAFERFFNLYDFEKAPARQLEKSPKRQNKPNLDLSIEELDLICKALSDSMNYKPEDRISEKWDLLTKCKARQILMEEKERGR